MKTCVTCKVSKLESEFWGFVRAKDGLQYSCKKCQNIARAEHAKRQRLPTVLEVQRRKQEALLAKSKQCRVCERVLPISQFTRSAGNSDGRSHQCKSCWSEYSKRFRNTEEFKLKQRERSRKFNYSKYGTTPEEVDARVIVVGNACEICGSSFDTAKMHVDHFHDLGGLRGVLCDYCNKGIGCFKESPEVVMAAAEYMRRAYNLKSLPDIVISVDV